MEDILKLFWFCFYNIKYFVSFNFRVCFIYMLQENFLRPISFSKLYGYPQKIQSTPCIPMLSGRKGSAFLNNTLLKNSLFKRGAASLIQNFLDLYGIIGGKNNLFFV